MSRRIRPGSIGQYFDGPAWEGKFVEVHSSTCAHCSRMTEFPSLRVMMEHVDICRSCMKLICLGCVGRGCAPFMKQVEMMEAENERRKHRARLGY